MYNLLNNEHGQRNASQPSTCAYGLPCFKRGNHAIKSENDLTRTGEYRAVHNIIKLFLSCLGYLDFTDLQRGSQDTESLEEASVHLTIFMSSFSHIPLSHYTLLSSRTASMAWVSRFSFATGSRETKQERKAGEGRQIKMFIPLEGLRRKLGGSEAAIALLQCP